MNAKRRLALLLERLGAVWLSEADEEAGLIDGEDSSYPVLVPRA